MEKRINSRQMTISEFIRYIDETPKCTRFQYVSENQNNYDVLDTCLLRLCFDEMIINQHPDVIVFKGVGRSMILRFVKSIECIENETVLGTILHVYCHLGINGTTVTEATHTIIMS